MSLLQYFAFMLQGLILNPPSPATQPLSSRALFSSASSVQTTVFCVPCLETRRNACHISQPEISLDTQPIISMYLA